MSVDSQRSALLLALLLSLGACRSTLYVPETKVPPDSLGYGELYVRSELYFGLSKPQGGMVAETEWRGFVDSVITPRFPRGLTILDAIGQWREQRGTIVREPSKVLIVVYPPNGESNRALEEIRSEYKRRFNQESVMRVTEYVRVGF